MQERILSRKFEKLNILKEELLLRNSTEDKSKVIKDIKEAIEDLEAILLDYGYIKEECERSFQSYRCYRDNAFYTREELEKYNGEDGVPFYIEVDGNVYDVTEALYDRDNINPEEIKDYFSINTSLLKNYTIVGKVK